jgi:starch synthase
MYKVLFVSPEVVPFAKTGGLADVAGTLPVALRSLGCDIRIIMPFYRMVESVATERTLVASGIQIPVGATTYAGDIWETRLNNTVPVYLVKCDEFFDRGNLYGTAQGDYRDNAQRFIFFSRCALEACIKLGYAPDIVHCHDWQAGLVPVYLKTSYRNQPGFSNTASVFTIHNIAYQGLFDKNAFSLTGLPEWLFGIDGLEYWGNMSILKGALIFSDVINTVSRKYSQEIQTPEFGYGMEGILARRRADLYGILNGVDYDEWNPATDRYIAAHYTSADLSGKHLCKKDVLKDYNLPARLGSRPLLGVISRLADQKGFDLLAAIIDQLMAIDLGFVLLGTGEQKYHDLFLAIAQKYPRKAGIKIAYNNALAHKIEAGCDIFLMPSRYEPCGLNQIYSLKYGTVPVVRATGGLDDTIMDYDERTGQGNGFKFTEYRADDFSHAIQRALTLYANMAEWSRLVKNCMAYDFSWEQSARQYLELYGTAIQKVKREEKSIG